MNSKPDTNPSSLPALVYAGLIGALAVGLVFNWSDIFSGSLLTGGDLPAHIVLMDELGKSLRDHQTIVHYSTRFWSGFELFQFYFPLPYIIGAVLAWFIHPSIALKLVIVAPLILTPAAFARLAQVAGAGFIGTVLASTLSLPFLFTRAHVMWGGNIFSTLAGMIGNGWMFVFLPLALAEILNAHRMLRFSLRAALLIALTGLCHFYGLLTLAIILIAMAAGDVWRLVRGRITWRAYLAFYSTFALAALLLSWWALPLPFSSAYSSEFGGAWRIDLPRTFQPAMLVIGAVSLLVLVASVVRKTDRLEERIFVVCLPLSVALFYFSDWIPQAVFTNIRLWPTVFFSLILTIILAAIRLERMLPRAAAAALLLIPWLLRPSDDAVREAREWSRWNFRGLEGQGGWPEFSQVLQTLRALPQGRVSFESDDRNNSFVGTVRIFEALPFLSQHDIVEGGIVNSATYPGVAYILQCLTSRSCAGWPRGTVVPGRDLERAADLMRGMGVRYHIASTAESRAALDRQEGVKSLLQTARFGVYEISSGRNERGEQGTSLVDVFDGPPLVLSTPQPGVALLSTARVDRFRRAPFVFLDAKSPSAPWPRTDPQVFIDAYVREWTSGRRVRDRSWENVDLTHTRRLNTFIHFPFLSDRLLPKLESLPNFQVGDRSFDPDVFYFLGNRTTTTVFLPLWREQAGTAVITPHFNGWRAFLGERELAPDAAAEIEFPPAENEPSRQTIRFVPAPSPHHPSIDIYTDDPLVQTGFGTGDDLSLPKIVNERCHPQLEVGFHQMKLQTSCPGLPHLIKFSYYPKWKADVPIFRGTNGYMLVVPPDTVLNLRHEPRMVDILGWCLTTIGLLICLGYYPMKKLARYPQLPL